MGVEDVFAQEMGGLMVFRRGVADAVPACSLAGADDEGAGEGPGVVGVVWVLAAWHIMFGVEGLGEEVVSRLVLYWKRVCGEEV